MKPLHKLLQAPSKGKQANLSLLLFTIAIIALLMVATPGFSQDENLTLVNRLHFDSDETSEMVIPGNGYAYFAVGVSGIKVYDLADPLYPKMVNIVDTPGQAFSVAVQDTVLAVSLLEKVTLFYSIADPANPTYFGETPTAMYTQVHLSKSVLVTDDQVFRIKPNFQLEKLGYGQMATKIVFIDSVTAIVSDLGWTAMIRFGDQREVIGVYNGAERTKPEFAVSMPYVYIPYELGFDVVDFSDPAKPKKVATRNYDRGTCDNLAIKGNRLYTHGIRDYTVWDITVKNNPQQLEKNTENNDFAQQIIVEDDVLYTPTDWQLFTYDISGDTIVKSPYVDGGGWVKDMKLFNDHLFILATEAKNSSLRVVDISQPGEPVEVHRMAVSDSAQTITLKDTLLFVTQSVDYQPKGGVLVYDINSPVDIEYLCTLPATASQIAVWDTVAYAVVGEWIAVYDISHLPAYDHFHSIPVRDMGNEYRSSFIGVTVKDGKLATILRPYPYVQTPFMDAFNIFDISNPRDIKYISNYELRPSLETSQAIWRDDHLYLVDNRSGFRIFDLENLNDIHQVGKIKTGNYRSLSIDGDYAVLPHYGRACHLMNIENPLIPYLVGSATLKGEGKGGLLHNGFLYVVDSWTLYGYDIAPALRVSPIKTSISPDRVTISGIAPNPFNFTTTITFQTSVPSDVTISAYDLSGRVVARLVDGFKQAGSHIVNWNAGHVANGLYIVRLEGNGFSASKKVVLIK